MGNADKISLRREVDHFLGSMKIKQGNENKPYDLVEEYSKTRKNKSKFIPCMIAGCVLFTSIASFGVYKFVQKSNDKISININSFDDLNLRSLLNMVGRSEARYENSLRELITIENEYRDAKAILDGEKAGELQILDSVKNVLSAKKYKTNKADIEQKYAALQKTLDDSYAEKISKAEAEIEKCKKEIARYDSSKLEKAHSEESAIDSQKQLYDLEIKQLTKKYETRIEKLRKQAEEQQKKARQQQKAAVEEVRRVYQARIDQLDPLIKGDTKGEKINIQFKNTVPDVQSVFNSLPEGSDVADYVDIAKKSLADFNYVSKVVADIPQENSIPSYVNAMRNLTLNTVQSMSDQTKIMQDKISDLQNVVSEKETEIDYFKDYLENYFLAGMYDAFILERVVDYEFQIFVSKNKQHYFDDDSKVYNCLIYDEKKTLSNGRAYSKNGKYYVNIVVPPRAKDFVVKNGYRITIGEEITQ